MVGERSRYGLSVSALGAIVLAVSLFLPWYGTSPVQQAAGGPLASQHLAALSGEHALRDLSIVLLALAGLAMLDALLPLVRTRAPLPGGAGGSVVLLGIVASACVLYRMVDPPASVGALPSPSLREGAWLALLGSLAMALGGMWPRYRDIQGAAVGDVQGAAVGDAPRALSW